MERARAKLRQIATALREIAELPAAASWPLLAAGLFAIAQMPFFGHCECCEDVKEIVPAAVAAGDHACPRCQATGHDENGCSCCGNRGRLVRRDTPGQPDDSHAPVKPTQPCHCCSPVVKPPAVAPQWPAPIIAIDHVSAQNQPAAADVLSLPVLASRNRDPPA